MEIQDSTHTVGLMWMCGNACLPGYINKVGTKNRLPAVLRKEAQKDVIRRASDRRPKGRDGGVERIKNWLKERTR